MITSDGKNGIIIDINIVTRVTRRVLKKTTIGLGGIYKTWVTKKTQFQFGQFEALCQVEQIHKALCDDC